MVAVAALAAALVPMCHPNRLGTLRANLDNDRALERVLYSDAHDCAHTSFSSTVTLVDRCRGVSKEYTVGHAQAPLVDVRIRKTSKEVFFVLGTQAQTGVAKVVRLFARRGRCPAPAAVFSYKPSLEATSYSVAFVAATLRVLETGPEFQQTRLYRYDRALKRYVLVKTQPA